jgi:hypothetical protein
MSDSDEDFEELLKSLSIVEPIKELSEDEMGGKKDCITVPPRPRVTKVDVSVANVENDQHLDLLMQSEPESKDTDLSAIFKAQLRKVASQYGSVFEDIISNYQKDREQAQEVIDQFMQVISTGGKVPRIYLEKIADAVRAKNEIAQTAIKALDALPKLISATKGNDMFTNNVGISFDAAHLKEILDAAEGKDTA